MEEPDPKEPPYLFVIRSEWCVRAYREGLRVTWMLNKPTLSHTLVSCLCGPFLQGKPTAGGGSMVVSTSCQTRLAVASSAYALFYCWRMGKPSFLCLAAPPVGA